IEDLWGNINVGFVQLEAKGRSLGMLMMWDTNIFSYEQAVGDERFMAVKGTWKGIQGDIYLVCIYGPHVGNQKISLWDRLCNLMNSEVDVWCLFRDFNEVRSADDRKNTTFNTKEADEFNEFINRAQLIDISMGGRRFTRVSDDGKKFSKLDRFLVSDEFKKKWQNLSAIAVGIWAAGENRASCSDKLDDALWAFRTTFKTPIVCTPYKLVYEKTCHLPIELEHKAYWALEYANFDLKIAGDHRKVYPYGTVELSQPDGPNFKVNGHRLKHYFREDVSKLVVPDLQTFARDH
nr:RNA-directed DNA polymerase, eukaryota [Tanacetum cinerariifolium]